MNITFDFDDEGIISLTLVNASGVIKHNALINKNDKVLMVPIDVMDFEKGIYLLNVELNDENFESQNV